MKYVNFKFEVYKSSRCPKCFSLLRIPNIVLWGILLRNNKMSCFSTPFSQLTLWHLRDLSNRHKTKIVSIRFDWENTRTRVKFLSYSVYVNASYFLIP